MHLARNKCFFFSPSASKLFGVNFQLKSRFCVCVVRVVLTVSNNLGEYIDCCTFLNTKHPVVIDKLNAIRM